MYLEFTFDNVARVIKSNRAFNNIKVLLRYRKNHVLCRVTLPCVLSQLDFPANWNVVFTYSSFNYLYMDIYKLF